MLSAHDGLRPAKDLFSFSFQDKIDWRDVSFCGYGESMILGIEKCQQTEGCPEGIIVIGVTGNGDYVCFDYSSISGSIEPPVVLMLHDFFDDSGLMMTIPVAPGFEAFLKSLKQTEHD